MQYYFYVGFNSFQKNGRVMVMDAEHDSTLIQDLMAWKSHLDAIIVKCFDSNDRYVQVEKDAFNYFINTRPNIAAELIGDLDSFTYPTIL